MDPLAVSGVVFACILGGVLLGIIFRALLPEEHLSAESKELVRLGMGLIGTMTALVLGLLIASAKSSFDTQRNGLAQLSAHFIFLDRILAHYGTEAKDARELLRASVADMLERNWPAEFLQSGKTEAKVGTEGRYEAIFERIQELAPKNEDQRTLQTQALKTAMDIGQTRWLLFAQKGSSIPTPFLVVMVSWITLLLASFSLFAPRNATAFVTLFVCALAISSAVFLILELDQPFQGLLQLSSAPLRNALAQLGR
ncbi:MAG: bestrophin-like domain [Gemmataceae bacterium]